MKKLFLSFLGVLIIGCSAQKTITNSSPAKDKAGNLVGIATKESFLQQPYNTWFTPKYDAYDIDETVVKEFEPLLKNITIKAFMGTWCGDSREYVPVFYKIMDKADFMYKDLELIAVNRNKRTSDNLQRGYNIIRVPTFIFFKNGVEIGRFVEYPRETTEADFLKILSGKSYKHSYEVN